jgi:hypothetical protein
MPPRWPAVVTNARAGGPAFRRLPHTCAVNRRSRHRGQTGPVAVHTSPPARSLDRAHLTLVPFVLAVPAVGG